MSTFSQTVIADDGYIRRGELAPLGLRPGLANPYAVYEQLRARGTLASTSSGNWATASYRLCDAVLRDRRLGVNRLAGVPGGEADESYLSFLEMNPPDHTRLRRLAMPAFSPKVVASYSGQIERVVGNLLDTVAGVGEFDLMSAFAEPLPIVVATELLGIPEPATTDFVRYGTIVGRALDGIQSPRHAAELKVADAELRELFGRLFDLRRREPREDIVSHLVAAEGDQIRPAEILPMCNLLLVAGFETTVNLIGNGVLALLDHPEQWEALRADPAAMAARAAEEALRYDPPVQLTSRTALEPLELEGQRLRRGQGIFTLIGGANRDPEVYDRPGTFDITRDSPAPHLAFSSGIHYCIGQPFARLEATIAFRMLAERIPRLARAGRVRRHNSTTMRGLRRLPVTAAGS